MSTLRRFGALVALAPLGALGAFPVPAAAAARPAPRGWVVSHVRFEPLDPAGAPLVADGVGQFRGALELRPGAGGLAVINDVGLEDYVKGISEVPVSWPAEAQKAQAIAARTYALHEMGNSAATSWRAAGANICATDSCQVYTGLEKERRPGAQAWVAAVEATRGQVLLHGGRPILAKYSSSNGGTSVAGGKPYLRSVPDPDDRLSPNNHWRHAIPLATVATLFAVPGALFDAGTAAGAVVLTSRLPDGLQHQQVVGLADFRDRVNAAYPAPAGLPRAIPSLRFTLSTNGDGVVVDGRGWGHGIGLSQYGALGKARRGLRAAQILAAYYGGLTPVALPPERLPATVRVAVAMGRGAAAVSAPGRFRVLGPDGQPLAALALGRWTVTGAGRGVRVVPPPGYDQPLALQPVGLEPGLSGPGVPAALRVRLSTPAVLTVTVAPRGGPPVTVAPQVVDPGDQVVALPPAPRPGEVQVTLAADAGPGRAAVVPFSYRVPGGTSAGLPSFVHFSSERPAPAGRAPAGPPGPVRPVLGGVAVLLLVATASGVVLGPRLFRRRPTA